jgi:hypothetical protein
MAENVRLRWLLSDKGISGAIQIDDNIVDLREISGVFHRFMNVDYMESAAGNNPDAAFNENQILGNSVDDSHVIRMFVNGVPNFDFENYVIENQDDIVPHLPPRAKLAKALAKLDDRLQRLAQYPYAAVGKLQFINWKNEIQSEGFFLEWRRLCHLAAMLAKLRFKEIGGAHSITAAGNYQRVPCAQG